MNKKTMLSDQKHGYQIQKANLNIIISFRYEIKNIVKLFMTCKIS